MFWAKKPRSPKLWFLENLESLSGLDPDTQKNLVTIPYEMVRKVERLVPKPRGFLAFLENYIEPLSDLRACEG